MLGRLPSLLRNTLMTQLAQVVRRIEPQVINLVQRMEYHVLARPWHPEARWAALTLYAVPVLRILLCPVDRVLAKRGRHLPASLRGVNNAAGYFEATAGILRDGLAVPLIVYSAHRQESGSLDWYLPEIIAGMLTAYGLYQKVKLFGRIEPQTPLSREFKDFAQGLRIFTRSV